MVTIEQLKSQIRRQEDKIEKAKQKQEAEFQKASLSKQLKILKRSPSTSKNIDLARRTGRGLKRLTGIAGRALINQAKLIKEQQLREDAAFAKGQKRIASKSKKRGKKLSKASKRRRKKLSKKVGGKSITISLN